MGWFKKKVAKIKWVLGLLSNWRRDIYFLNILNPPLILCGWVKIKHGKLIRRNFGDDLNEDLISLISGKRVVFYEHSFLCHLFKPKRIMAIGSIINKRLDDKCIVWGSGSQLDDLSINVCKPDIRAVRGPLTRDWLLSQGINCSKVYGDPALLLPFVYRPKIEKKYELGIIPNFNDNDDEFLISFKKRYPETHIIKMSDYGNWKHVIEEIVACKHIVSSSLHGLIISDAYMIPNAWIKLGCTLGGKDFFKYRDYYSSVGKSYITKPFVFSEETSLEELLDEIKEWKPGIIDLNPLIKSCPFKINIKDYQVKQL